MTIPQAHPDLIASVANAQMHGTQFVFMPRTLAEEMLEHEFVLVSELINRTKEVEALKISLALLAKDREYDC